MNSDKAKFSSGIKNRKYIDDYIEKWLKLKTVDRPYVECEVCGYVSNACIHQHLLIPEELKLNPINNRILHLCANCYYEHRALIDKHSIGVPREKITQVCEEVFELLKARKKGYRDMNRELEGVHI